MRKEVIFTATNAKHTKKLHFHLQVLSILCSKNIHKHLQDNI